MILETTLSSEFTPGTNLTGGVASADWRYLLPSQELEHLLCLGIPSLRTLTVLSTISRRVHVVSSERYRVEKIEKEFHNQGVPNVQFICVEKFSNLPFYPGSMDLVYLADSRGNARYLRQPETRQEINKLLKPQGVLYFEIHGLGQCLGSRKILKMLAGQGFNLQGSFWLTPFGGDLRTALPVEERDISSYFFSNVIYGQSFKKRALSRFGKALSDLGLIGALAPRHALLLKRSPENDTAANGYSAGLPEYISALAEKSGVNLSQYNFGLSARGKFNANKVIFFLFGKPGDSTVSRRAEVVIKMTRSAEFNRRLENEHRILSLLKSGAYVDPATYPEPLFFGYHNGLAAIGMRAVHGKPFRTRTLATPQCPIARDAIEWIIRLGGASAKPIPSAGPAAEALEKLLNMFRGIYPLGEEEDRFLARQLETVAHSEAPFPLVFQHGDPGTWNMMVSAEDKVIVIDWEAGEPEGIPLWDLFYFFRTYASWVSRQQGSRDSLKNFSENFLAVSAMSEMLAEITQRYCANVGLNRQLIKPLFYTCWMHRALKEATRLTEKTLETGHYFNVLRMSIAEQDNPALEALFRD